MDRMAWASRRATLKTTIRGRVYHAAPENAVSLATCLADAFLEWSKGKHFDYKLSSHLPHLSARTL